MNKKIGRPPKDKTDLNNIRISVNVNLDLYTKIKKYATNDNLTNAEFVRKCAIIALREYEKDQEKQTEIPLN